MADLLFALILLAGPLGAILAGATRVGRQLTIGAVWLVYRAAQLIKRWTQRGVRREEHRSWTSTTRTSAPRFTRATRSPSSPSYPAGRSTP